MVLRAASALVLAAVLAMALAAGMPAPKAHAASEQPSPSEALQGAVEAVHDYAGAGKGGSALEHQDKLPAGDSVADWIAFDLARVGADKGTEAYRTALEQYVTGAYATTEQLDRNQSTPWSRVALTAAALGGDPTAFGTDPSGSPIDLVADGTYNWKHTSDLGYQGTNAWCYALYAIDGTGVTVPDDAAYTAERMVGELLALQNENGSWGLTAGAEDTDITSMAIVALAPHTGEPQVSSAIERGLDFLAYAEGGDGTFSSAGVSNSESCSMVILALCSVGIDPTDPSTAFCKNGTTVYDGLMSFRRADGSFSHTADDDQQDINLMPTEQAMRALIATEELRQGGDGDVYTMDVQVTLSNYHFNGNDARWLGVGIAVGAAAMAVACLVLWRRRRRQVLD